MSKKTKSSDPLLVTELTYEQAAAELEAIVRQLEGEALPLDVALARFERGQALAAHCTAVLEAATLKVRVLTQTNDLAEFRESDSTSE